MSKVIEPLHQTREWQQAQLHKKHILTWSQNYGREGIHVASCSADWTAVLAWFLCKKTNVEDGIMREKTCGAMVIAPSDGFN
jgi:hypothetical protein